MKRIAIIGGGIVGATCAYYLSKISNYKITLIDHGEGQATKAACGIICPWLSQRRNKQWYELVKEGANFYQTLMKDLQKDGITQLPYVQTGTLVFKKTEQQLEKLMAIAVERYHTAPMIGQCQLISPNKVIETIPQFSGIQGAVFTPGGGRVDGDLLVQQLKMLAEKRGVTIISDKAHLMNEQNVQINNCHYHFDKIVLSVGAWLPEVLKPLGYQVDVHPQKGQLLEIDSVQETDQLPGMMLHGEIDILPFNNHRLVIGATHENDQGYDLQPNYTLLKNMQLTANNFLPVAQYDIKKVRVGIRAYTSDYQPFFGQITRSKLFVASGLGSSGLTSGPIIGYLLACLLTKQHLLMNIDNYHPDKYIQ